MGHIILEADYLVGSDAFEVSVLVEGKEYRETMSRGRFVSLCNVAGGWFEVGGLTFVYSTYDKRDIGPRARRSFKQYFTSLLAKSMVTA